MYVNSDPDRQCVCGRKGKGPGIVLLAAVNIGILCGECEPSEGVSALLNNCITCSNSNISVLIPLLGTIIWHRLILLVI